MSTKCFHQGSSAIFPDLPDIKKTKHWLLCFRYCTKGSEFACDPTQKRKFACATINVCESEPQS